MFMLIQRSLKVISLGLCAAVLLVSGLVEAKSTNTQPAVTTQGMEEEETETSTTPQRMRLLPGAQRRAERRRGVQSTCPNGKCRAKAVSKQSTMQFGHSLSGFNVSETRDNVIVTMNVSGFTADEIAVNVEGNMIGITAESSSAGSQNILSNAHSLPCPVNVAGMTKKLSNGVLTITLPKIK